MKNVMGFGTSLRWWSERKGAAKRDQTAVALKGKRNSMAEPAKRGVKIAFMVPWM